MSKFGCGLLFIASVGQWTKTLVLLWKPLLIMALCHELKFFGEARLDIQSSFLGNLLMVMSGVVQLCLIDNLVMYVWGYPDILGSLPNLRVAQSSLLGHGLWVPGFCSEVSTLPSLLRLGVFLFFSFWGSLSPNCRMASSFWEFGVSSNSAYFLFDFITSSHCGFLSPLLPMR